MNRCNASTLVQLVPPIRTISSRILCPSGELSPFFAHRHSVAGWTPLPVALAPRSAGSLLAAWASDRHSSANRSCADIMQGETTKRNCCPVSGAGGSSGLPCIGLDASCTENSGPSCPRVLFIPSSYVNGRLWSELRSVLARSLPHNGVGPEAARPCYGHYTDVLRGCPRDSHNLLALR
jgi:hypothetical protein